MTDLAPYLDFAERTAVAAGAVTLRYFGRGLEPERKADATPVTVADREAEQVVRQAIAARFPGHAVVGEEYGEENEGQTHRWIVDPIDGTRSFVRGVPLYGVLLALEIEGEVTVGVAHFPALRETISAAAGLGCRWQGGSAHVSAVADLRRALVVHADTASFARHGRGAAWARVQQGTEYRAGLSDAYGYLLVATGRAELMLDPIMSVWDCGPFAVILKEAGGYFGDWTGRPTIYAGEAMACNEALLPSVLELVRDSDEST